MPWGRHTKNELPVYQTQVTPRPVPARGTRTRLTRLDSRRLLRPRPTRTARFPRAARDRTRLTR